MGDAKRIGFWLLLPTHTHPILHARVCAKGFSHLALGLRTHAHRILEAQTEQSLEASLAGDTWVRVATLVGALPLSLSAARACPAVALLVATGRMGRALSCVPVCTLSRALRPLPLLRQVDTALTEVGGQDVSRMKDVLIQLKSTGLPASSG